MPVQPSKSSTTITGRAETSRSVKIAMLAVAAWAVALAAVVVSVAEVVSAAAALAAVVVSLAEAGSAEVTVDEEGTVEADPQVEPVSMPVVVHLLLLPHLTPSPTTLSLVPRRASSYMSET